MIAKEIIVEQGSDLWLSLRKNHLGSSDAASIMEVSKWSTPYQTWCEKLDLNTNKEDNSAMKRGRDLEPEARRHFEIVTGIEMTPKVFVKDFMIASFDGVSECNKIAVEIKCPGKADHESALNGIVPVHYYPQLQHQMMVLDLKEIYYLSYSNSESVVIFRVLRDEEYCQKLLDNEKEFWNYLQNLEPPPLCDRDFIEKNDSLWFNTTSEWKKVHAQLKSLEEYEEELRKKMIIMCNGKNCRGNNVKSSFYVRKGNINYKNIPEIKNVDLEQYRNHKTIVWKLEEL